MPELPRPIDGLTWRPATVDDAEAIAGLHGACYEADGGYLMVAAEYRDELTHPANDAAADSLIALDADGDVMVFGMVHMTGGDRSKHRAFPTGNVLYPNYMRTASTKGTYSCDTTGLVTQASTGY